MPEQIFTFTDEEVARMLENGELRLLTAPSEPVQKTKTEHEKALEKAKKLFGKDFEDVQTLEIGGKSALELKEDLIQANIYITYRVLDFLNSDSFITSPTPKKIEIIKIKISDLGFKEDATTQQIYQRAAELGLGLCPVEVGPYLRLQYIEQPFQNWCFIAMEPINDSYKDVPFAFDLIRFDTNPRLSNADFYPYDEWDNDNTFVFTINNEP